MGSLYPDFIFCDIFKIKLVEMGESTISAADSKMPAPDRQIVRAGHLTVPARGIFYKFPEIITADFCERPGFGYVLDSRDENPGCPTVITRYFSLVRNSSNDLIGNLPAMVAVRAIFREDEPVAHKR